MDVLILLKLYYVFFLIGISAFGGGYVILPLIENYLVNHYAWINTRTLIDIVAISQITPGPIAINASTFIGMIKGNILGAIVATLGVVTPQILILSIFLKYIGLENEFMKKIIDGINPATTSLIIVATINIAKGSLFTDISNSYNLDYRAIVCMIISFILYKFKINMIYIIVVCGLISALI